MNSTRNFEVGGLLSSMSARGVEKQLSRVPGVTAVAVNYVAGSASVSFEADQTSPVKIRSAIEACGYHCGGESTPAHVCAPHEAPSARHGHPGHVGHEAPCPAAGMKAAADAMPSMDTMAHEMGHGTGMLSRARTRSGSSASCLVRCRSRYCSPRNLAR